MLGASNVFLLAQGRALKASLLQVSKTGNW